jgi:hypothetical protein
MINCRAQMGFVCCGGENHLPPFGFTQGRLRHEEHGVLVEFLNDLRVSVVNFHFLRVDRSLWHSG